MTTKRARQDNTTRLIYETRDAAARLEVGPERVRTLVARGKLRPAFMTPRGVKLFEPAEIDRLVRERSAGVGRASARSRGRGAVNRPLELLRSPAMNERASEQPAAAQVVSVIPSSIATTCPRCGAPRRCCAGAAPGEPTDHGANA
jgi:hypothetical protein